MDLAGRTQTGPQYAGGGGMKITVSEISRRLGDRALEVAMMLLPGGKQSGHSYHAGDLSGGNGNSVVVHTSGSKMGRWAEYAEGKTNDTYGDMLDLWRVTRGVSAAEAIKQAKDYLGIFEPLPSTLKREYKVPTSNGIHPPHPAGVAMTYLLSRGLTKETLDTYKVGTHKERKAIVFECYDPRGNLLNRSYRTLDKKFTQEAGCAPCLFGWQSLDESVYRSKTILITEGQFDAMTFHQWGIPALSIPNGNGQTWIETSWEDLEPFDRIYLAFDQDEAGQKNASTVAARLGRHRCLQVRLPGKDANGCLQSGTTRQEAQKWILEAKPYKVDGFVTGSEMVDRTIEECRPKEEPFTLPMFRIEWPDRGLYFRPYEMTLWTGATHAGKSTLMNFMMVLALIRQVPIFIASMEVRVETTIRKMLSAALGGGESTADLVKQFLEQYGQYMTFADKVGMIGQDELLDMMRYAFHRYGCTMFVIDSLMRVEGLEEDYPAQGEFVNKLIVFSAETGTHVHLVAHARKTQDGQKPSKEDVKGSSLLINNTHNIVSISRNHKKDKLRKEKTITPEQEREMHDTEVTIEKQRESGWLGSFHLKFNSKDYTYTVKP